jgi:uncharacterized protein (DUF1697 family)
MLAFLRGINVAGHRKVKMEDIRQIHGALGHENVSTYLQSGNVIFDCGEKHRQELIRSIEAGYERELGLQTAVLIRSAAELGKIVADCPIPLMSGKDPKYLHVVLLSAQPRKSAIGNLMTASGPEEKQISGDALYVYYTQGSGRSKFNLAFIEKTLDVKATARNWNTVTKLNSLATRSLV